MNWKQFRDRINELVDQLETKDETEIFLIENWLANNAIQQDIRNIEITDINFKILSDTTGSRILTETKQGIILGYLNKVK